MWIPLKLNEGLLCVSVLGGTSFHLTLAMTLHMQFGNGIPDKWIKTLASEVRSNLYQISQRKLGSSTACLLIPELALAVKEQY